MSKSLTEMAQEIVQAQASAKQMTTEEVKLSLQQTFQMLKSLQANEIGGEEVEAAGQTGTNIDPKKSIKKNSIICLECGQEFKMLSAKHLASHDLDARSYRTKYGFPARQPLCAKGLSDRRSESSKSRGLPEKLKQYLDARSAEKKAREAAASAGATAASQTKKSSGGRKKARQAKPQE